MATNTPNINYTNKDFASIKANLLNLVQSYYNNNNQQLDLSPSSPINLFIDTAAYVGDILSFYTDINLQESLLQYTQEQQNINSLAYFLGYKPQVTSVATVTLDVYQLLPSDASNNYQPDYRYALTIPRFTSIQSTSQPSVNFLTNLDVNFNYSSSIDPTTITIYQTYINTSNPQFYLLKKSVSAISGQIKTQSFNFGNPQQFQLITLSDSSIVEIISAVDSQNNQWYEVPYLAQQTIFQPVQNNILNFQNFSELDDNTPYLLTLKKVQRRYTTRFLNLTDLQIEFGSGVSSSPDEEIIPNPNNVGIGLVDGISKLTTAYNPSNFLYTNEYGLAPSNTTITFSYVVGGGTISNLPPNDISILTNNNSSFQGYNLDPAISNYVRNNILFNNPSASSGGGNGDTVDTIRYNSIANFPSQLRNVTKEDYLIRTLSMPAQFGNVAKAYVTQDQLTFQTNNYLENNPLVLSIYVLSTNINGTLTQASPLLKQNLKTYLQYYKIDSDAVNIKDAYVINIGCKFSILISPNFNGQQVLANAILAVQNYFNINLWQINQPIILSDISSTLVQVQGIQNVISVSINNLVGGNYSPFSYDINGATKNGVIYPSLDPMIFEVLNPNTDIQGQIASL